MPQEFFTVSEAQALQGKRLVSFYTYPDGTLDKERICDPEFAFPARPYTVTGWENRGEDTAVITIASADSPPLAPPQVMVMDKTTFRDYFHTEPFAPAWDTLTKFAGKFICPLKDYENASLGIYIRHHTPCLVLGTYPWGWGEPEFSLCIKYGALGDEDPETQYGFIDKAIYEEYFGEPVLVPGELREPVDNEKSQTSGAYVLRTQSGKEYTVTASEGVDERIILELSFDEWTKICKDVREYQVEGISDSVRERIPAPVIEPSEDGPPHVRGEYILRTPSGNEYLLDPSEGGESRLVLSCPFMHGQKSRTMSWLFNFISCHFSKNSSPHNFGCGCFLFHR